MNSLRQSFQKLEHYTPTDATRAIAYTARHCRSADNDRHTQNNVKMTTDNDGWCVALAALKHYHVAFSGGNNDVYDYLCEPNS